MDNPSLYFPEPSRQAAIQERWPDLTADDIKIAGDDRERLIIRIVDRYGIAWEWAERQVAEWETDN